MYFGLRRRWRNRNLFFYLPHFIKVEEGKGVACPVRAGGCTIHTGRTLHFTGTTIFIASSPFVDQEQTAHPEEGELTSSTAGQR